MKKKFDTEIVVRPSDIDMNRHLHQSAYLDYAFFARFDQMKRCYKMPIEEFLKMGYSWATKSVFIEFNKPICLGETIIVRTWVDEVREKSVKVCFQFIQKETKELAAHGHGIYFMINIKTGRPEALPEIAVKKYSI